MISFGDTVVGKERQEILEHGTKEFPIACYFDDFRYTSVPWHWHEEIEVGIVGDGCIIIDTPNQQCHIAKGEGFFINSGILHTIQGENLRNCHLDSLVFHVRLIGGDKDSIFWRKYIRPIITNSGMAVLRFDRGTRGNPADIIKSAWMECVDGDYGFEFNVQHLLARLFLLINHKQPEISPTESKKMLLYNDRTKKMLTYIRGHFHERVTVRNIADSASISESECLRCFRNVLETSPIAYLKNYRMQKAAELISQTQWKISYIGEKCGFGEMSYFAKSFKEVYGCTPLEYRYRTTKQAKEGGLYGTWN